MTTIRSHILKRCAAITTLMTTILLCSQTVVYGQDPQPPQDPCAEVDCDELAIGIAAQEAVVSAAGDAVADGLDGVSDAERAVADAQMAVATADWSVSAAEWDVAILQSATNRALQAYLDHPTQENIDTLNELEEQYAAALARLTNAEAGLEAAEAALAAAQEALVAAEVALAEAQNAFYAELTELETLRGIQAMCCG